MAALIILLLNLGASFFKPKSLLEAENAALRRQLAVLQRKVRGRIVPIFAGTGAGNLATWEADHKSVRILRALVRQMSIENSLWGAPRIHGELLKLGFAVAQSTVAKYMAKKCDPFGQSWGTFLRNHTPHIAAMDLFVVRTISFNLLYVLVIVRLARRDLVWIKVTAYPTAEWIAQQITEAFPCNEVPRYLIRDRDGIYGSAVTRRLRAMGIPRQAHCARRAVGNGETGRHAPTRVRPYYRIE